MSTNRRSFLKLTGLAGFGLLAADPLLAAAVEQDRVELDKVLKQAEKKYKPIFNMSGYAAPAISNVGVAFIGIGNRGTGAVGRMSRIDGLTIKALCDVRQVKIDDAKKKIILPERHSIKDYSGNEEVWKEVCKRDDIDLVYICTNWSNHAEIAIYAMEHGKHVALEIPAATSVEDCWRLVMTSERTRKHCVMLENCCYDFFELLTLNMARQGFFGDIIHTEGAYIHDIFESLFKEEARYKFWRLEENAARNGNLYPTHGLGPVCQTLKVNRGNKMDFLTSMASKDFMLKKKAAELAKTDKRFEKYLNLPFRGNMNISNIMTSSGATISLQHDTTSPRPYSRIHMVSGTKAFAQKYPLPGKIAIGHKEFLNEEEMAKLENKYTPKLVSFIGEQAKKVGGHGGMDFIMDWRLIDCLRNGLPVDMDVYDAASWSAIGPLSEWSVANGSKPIAIPDFTMGRWKTNAVHDIELKTGGTTKVLSDSKA